MFQKIKNKAFLAPIAGISDPVFRYMCEQQGAGLTVTELTSIDYIYSEKQKALETIQRHSKEKLVGLQLFGKNPEKIKDAMEIVDSKFDFFDLNCGCPASNILQQGAGVELMRNTNLLKKMLTQIINNTNKPVTIKFRLGINKKIETFLDVGKLAEDLGISMVTLHARYAEQGYSGSADWNKIKLLKESLNVPVVGNGDISKPELALKMFEETNVDFVTVGRWSMGNPWCFSQINSFLKTRTYEEVKPETKILGFLEYLKEAKNYNINFAREKMHAMQFTKGIVGGVDLRRQIATAKAEEQIINTMNSFLEK